MPQKSKDGNDPVTQFLKAYAQDVQALASAARELMKELVPSAREHLYSGWKLIGYRNPHYFAGIAPQKNHCRILFEQGHLLYDPKAILLGDGKQVRFVEIHSDKDLRSAALRQFILEAAEERIK